MPYDDRTYSRVVGSEMTHVRLNANNNETAYISKPSSRIYYPSICFPTNRYAKNILLIRN